MGMTLQVFLIVAPAMMWRKMALGNGPGAIGSCPATVALEAACPGGWRGWAGACYRTTPIKGSGGQARALCRSLGGHLAVPASLAENEVVRGLIPEGSTAVHLGCRRGPAIGSWACETHSQHEGAFWHWREGSPGDDTLNEECLVMHRADGKWDDSMCRWIRFGVCKRFLPKLHL